MKKRSLLLLSFFVGGCAMKPVLPWNKKEFINVPLNEHYWDVVYNGGGQVQFNLNGTGDLLLRPKEPKSIGETYAALVIRKQPERNSLENYLVKVDFTVTKQLRDEAPNDWEVFWFFGNYRKDAGKSKTANYLILKPKTGVELGLVFDEVGQKFLKTQERPLLVLGQRTQLIYFKMGKTFRVYQDDQLIFDYQNPGEARSLYDQAGAFGLYSEDAEVRIHAFSYIPL